MSPLLESFVSAVGVRGAVGRGQQIVRSPQLAQAVAQLDHVLQSGQVGRTLAGLLGVGERGGEEKRGRGEGQGPLSPRGGRGRGNEGRPIDNEPSGRGDAPLLFSSPRLNLVWRWQGRQVVQSFGLPPEAAGGPGFDAVGPGKARVLGSSIRARRRVRAAVFVRRRGRGVRSRRG